MKLRFSLASKPTLEVMSNFRELLKSRVIAPMTFLAIDTACNEYCTIRIWLDTLRGMWPMTEQLSSAICAGMEDAREYLITGNQQLLETVNQLRAGVLSESRGVIGMVLCAYLYGAQGTV